MKLPDEVIDGCYLRYTPQDPIFADMVYGKSGCVIGETERVEAGMGMEPSGYSFMNYVNVTTYTFHPYDGSPPVPCERPDGKMRMTRQLTRQRTR